jgi:hypothetical protein
MIEILTVMCIISVNLTNTDTSMIVTQGNAINTDGDYWTVDFYESLSEGGYNMDLNTGAQTVNSNECNIVKLRKAK